MTDKGIQLMHADIIARLAADAAAHPVTPEMDAAFTAERQAENMAERQAERKAKWQTICPSWRLYGDTDEARIPAQDAYRAALAWVYGPQGLALVGGPGRGKTRALHAVAYREHMAGRSVMWFDPPAWYSAGAAAAREPERLEEHVRKLARVDLLVIDDLGKSRTSEAQAMVLFGVIERRMGAQRPILISMNATGAELENRLTPPDTSAECYGGPIRRRLLESCRAIAFVG